MNKKILIALMTSMILFTACSGRDDKVPEPQQQLQQQETEITEKLETEENSQEEDFSQYSEYINTADDAGLIYREFSKGNYPTENVFLLYVVDNDKLDGFEGTFNGRDCTLHKAEDVEENLKEKFDITTEELREILNDEYIEDKNAYPEFSNEGFCHAGGGTVIKDVIQEENTFKIYYECGSKEYNPVTECEEEKLDFDGILTVSKEGKIISNSDIKHY